MSQIDLKQIVAVALAAEIAKKIVTAAFLACGAVSTWFAGAGSASVSTLGWPIVATVVFGAALAFLVIAQRQSIYRCRYPAIAFQTEILEKSCSYVINEHGELLYSKRIKLKALRDQMDEYIDRYFWSGGGVPKPEPGEGAQEITEVARVGVWEYYRIFFGRVLHRGDVHEIEITWPLTNWRDSSPFVALSTREPTHKLVFDVKLPADEVGGSVLAEEIAGIDSIYPFNTEEIELDHGRCRWVVDRPSLYTQYRLRWTWKGAQAKTIPVLVEEAKAVEGTDREAGPTRVPHL
ncbi:hypothetical protein [Stackebrandtia nassauensis]|uniref:Uncharacterized protein n=1 Tax=Stackebrandtia nassauensis (strain DSM 44728 / CIP 108903 / NRRL B-16338 / NBRC 102104 / LLR-40K-21) TaxID=446470 RepID=D3QAE6_STANL|nr:hypothetical protein [Stackebrandtia nassauensis]ADD42729.1 hypothetical protein Snas_3058 [Stackebrandtia nassauensis DSM 44728]